MTDIQTQQTSSILRAIRAKLNLTCNLTTEVAVLFTLYVALPSVYP
jgi:hypothetical protein